MRSPTNRRDFLKLSGGAILLPTKANSSEADMGRSQQSVFVQTTAADWEQVAELSADDEENIDSFGHPVEVDGDTIVIGAQKDEDSNGDDAGSAYVYRRSGGSWSEEAKLTVHNADSTELYDTDIGIDGDTVVIGARNDEDPNGDDAGSAYVYRRSGGSWSEEAKLTASDGDSEDFFGVGLEIDGDTIVIGAWRDEDPNGDKAGSAYVYRRSGGSWNEEAKLTASDGDSEDFFGAGIEIDGDTVVVGARADEDPNGDDAGSAYVYRRSGGSWNEEAKLTASDGDSEDWFGADLGIDGDTIVIGAWRDEDPNGDKAGSASVYREGGSAYVYRRSGGSWNEEAKLTASDGDDMNMFGAIVEMDGDTVVIGADSDADPNGDRTGSAYVYRRSGGSWSEEAKLTASDGDSTDRFGVAVGIDGNTIIVGADTYRDSNEDRSNSAYVFERGGRRPNNQPPNAEFNYSPQTPNIGEEITFDASESNDPDGSISKYEWDVSGEGEFEKTGAQVTHTFSMPGERSIALRVTDNDGVTDTTQNVVTTNLKRRAEKLELARGIDEVLCLGIDNNLCSDYNDETSAENTIDGLQEGVIDGDISPETAKKAVERLVYAEQVTEKRMEIMTPPPNDDYNNTGGEERNLAGHTAEFALKVGVKILLVKFYIARRVSEVIETVQEIGTLIDRIQEAYEELIRFVRTGSPDLGDEIEEKTNSIAESVYTDTVESNTNTAEEVAQSIESEIDNQKEEIAKGLRGKEEIRKYKNDPEAPPEVYDIAGSLHYLHQELSVQSLKNSGLQGTQDGADGAAFDGKNRIQGASDGAHNTMVDNNRRVNTIDTAETVTKPVADSWGFRTELFSLVIDLVTGVLQGLAAGTGLGKINKITGIHAEAIIKIIEGTERDTGGLY